MTKQLQDAYIVAATRTPIGKAPRGMFRNTRPDDLLVAAIRSAMNQVPGLDPKLIEDAIIGCSFPEGESGLNMARNAVLLAGLPNTVGGVTVNRFCASGITAVAMAADRIRVGQADVMIAGGAESMSMVPMGGFHPSINMNVFADENVGMAYGMGLTAEKVATQWKVTREMQDQFALESHQRAIAGQQAGEFNDETTAVEIVERVPNLASGEIELKKRSVNRDEGARAESTLAALAKLKPVFAAKGSVTAGNSSQTSDGAGALILVSEKILKAVQPDAAGALRLLRRARRAARDHGHRPQGSDPGRLQGRRHHPGSTRLDRTQRGLRRAVAGGDPGPRPRSGQGESDRRRHRAGPPARCHRRDPLGHGDPRAAPAQSQVRHGDHVRRHRHGRGGDFRADVRLGKEAAVLATVRQFFSRTGFDGNSRC
jgi:acetyl-CoA acetyltransferase family protein